uniref:Uncharacterized protein n=1 Tax=viral metagenome TaxID=1070528 RepID=A0A6M3JLW9_9ZZZZ
MSNFIRELKNEYRNQDNRATAYPIYVTVQELVCVGVMADGYSVCCPYGDGETRIEYRHPEFEETYENKRELIEFIENNYYPDENKSSCEIEKIEELNIGYIWHPVEFFLTIKGAEEYIEANSHNHGKLRTYVHHFERRNFEMRNLLEALEFKINDPH